MSNDNNDAGMAESLEDQLDHAAEELITGDSDDPPLSEETVVEMVNDSDVARLKPMSRRSVG